MFENDPFFNYDPFKDDPFFDEENDSFLNSFDAGIRDPETISS